MIQTPSSPNGQYVQVNGLNMYYEEFGSGEPLIFIHGGMGVGQNFEHLIPAFSEQFRVITPDSRGHGRTDNPGEELSYRLMADDMAAFINVLKLDRPWICGWSDGGQIALELGMHYPLLMRGMVVGAAWYKFSQRYQTLLKAMGIESPGLVNMDRLKQALAQLADMWQSWHSTIHGSDYWERLLTQISTMWWTPLGYTAEDFQKIKTATLILIGDRDPLIPLEEAVDMYRFIPGSELVVVANGDHSVPNSQAELFTALVLDFLVRHRHEE